MDGTTLSFTQMSSAYQAAILGKLREKYRLVHNSSHLYDTADVYTRAAWGSALSNLSITTSQAAYTHIGSPALDNARLTAWLACSVE